MPKVHGRNAHFAVTDIGGVSRILSSYMDSLDFPAQIDTAPTEAFGDTDKSVVVGLRSHTIKIAGKWDGTATTGPDDVLANLLGQGAAGTVITTFIAGPAGSASGNVKYSGTCVLTGYNPSAQIAGAVTFSADFFVNGAVTRGTF